MTFLRNTIRVAVDDFGISEKANHHIITLVKAGVIDRVAVMTEGTLSKSDVQTLLHSGVALDIHLEIHNPFRSRRKLKDGILNRLSAFFLGYCSGKTSVAAVAKQWDAQIRQFQNLFGRSPDGLNSHEHTHFFPPYFKLLLRLAQQHNISYVRIGTESVPESAPVSRILNWLRRRNQKSLRESERTTSDLLVSFDWLTENRDILAYPQEKNIELIFHPERDEEMKLLEKLT
jgi:predicted glycoside hydrolase/deacetylase ChbG (UPF0249 family)